MLGTFDVDLSLCNGAIGIQVQRTAEGPSEGVVGRLLGLSLQGAEVSLESAIPAEEGITLKLHNTSSNSELSTGGKIERIVAGTDGSWIVGCLFTTPLPQLALHDLFRGDIAEKRKSTRYPIVGEAMIEWESAARTVVQLEDISAGGFQMLAKQSATIGARLNLVLRTTDHRRFVVPAVARWQLESANGYAIGCQFLYEQGQHLMRAILPGVTGREPLNLARILQKLVGLPPHNRPGKS